MDDYESDEDDCMVDFNPFEYDDSESEYMKEEEEAETPENAKEVQSTITLDLDIDRQYSLENKLDKKVNPHAVELQIIRAVKDYPCIYDRKSEHFKNQEIMDKAYNNVASKVKLAREICRQKWVKLFREFSITYVILRDKQLRERGYHRRNIFIYYDHMLYFKDQVNVPVVRQNQVQEFVNMHERGRKPKGHKPSLSKQQAMQAINEARANIAKDYFDTSVYHRLQADVLDTHEENTKLTDIDLAYVNDNALHEKIHPDDFNVKLINEVKNYPCLYDRTSENFKNTNLRDHAWIEVSQNLSAEKKRCKNTFGQLIKDFSTTYVILHDPELLKMNLLNEIFIYYDHMLFFKKEINIPLVRSNHIRVLVKAAEKTSDAGPRPESKNRRRRRKRECEADFNAFEGVWERKTLKDDIDKEYLRKYHCQIYKKDKNVIFINAIRERPCLYDPNHPDYKVNKDQQPAWKEVANITNMPILDCFKKFKELTWRFSSTYVILREPTLVEMGCDKMFRYYEPMLFYKPFVNVHKLRKTYVKFLLNKCKSQMRNEQLKQQASKPTNIPKNPWNEKPRYEGPVPHASTSRTTSRSSNPNDPMNMNFHKRLIDIVIRYPCLYNINSDDYYNVNLKEIVWEDVSRQCARESSDCRNTFNNLVKKFGETYVGEMISRISGTEPTFFPLYRDLHFLKPYIPLQEIKNNLLQDPKYTLAQKMMIMEFTQGSDAPRKEDNAPRDDYSHHNKRQRFNEAPREFNHNDVDNSRHSMRDTQRSVNVHPDEVDSYFYDLSQKIKRSNIGSFTFIDIQSAVLNVLANKLPNY